MRSKLEVMDKEFDFLKTKLEEEEGRAKGLRIENEALREQLKEFKE